MLYLPASESLESLESLLSESDELLLLALSRLAGTADTLAPADDGSNKECSVQPHIIIYVNGSKSQRVTVIYRVSNRSAGLISRSFWETF